MTPGSLVDRAFRCLLADRTRSLRLSLTLADSNAAAYSSSGFSTGFLVGEYILGIAMEWVSCVLLIATHFSALNGGNEVQEDHHARDHDKLAGDEVCMTTSQVKAVEP